MSKITGNELQKLQTEYLAKCKSRSVTSYVECVDFHFAGYAEPGYKDPESGVIATGNWNSHEPMECFEGKWFTGPEDNTAKEFGEALEALGVELEWSGEWATCDDCHKLVRTEPDCYHWQVSYVSDENQTICLNCLDHADHLMNLEGKDTKCNTIATVKPEEHGYRIYKEKLDNGFHTGMDDEPRKIGKELREKGVKRYLFNLDDKSQFYVTFSCWVHSSEHKFWGTEEEEI